MHSSLDRALTGALTVAALAVALAVVHREFFADQSGKRRGETPRYEPAWRRIALEGRTTGNREAPIAIVEFSDLECPFCKRFHATLRALQKRHPGQISHSFVHFPLSGHRNALRAARASECAAEVGRFSEALDVLFEYQDSLGEREWPWFASRTGVADNAESRRCLADSTVPRLVDRGKSVGASLGIIGTPIIYLNGWRYPGMPVDTELFRAVDDLLSGRKPYRGFPADAINARLLASTPDFGRQRAGTP